MLLIDPPLWTAHGRLWSHLVSDTSVAELHRFADRVGLPAWGFEGDHYDVPQERYAECVAAGAREVAPREVVRALQRAGLRVQKRRGERVVHTYAEPAWLPPGSRADVIASRQEGPPAQTVVVRLAVLWTDPSEEDRVLVRPRTDGDRGPDLPSLRVDGSVEAALDRLTGEHAPGSSPVLRGYVRNTVPDPTPDYRWPAPRASFAVWSVTVTSAPREGTWRTHARAERELSHRHWWPLFAGGLR